MTDIFANGNKLVTDKDVDPLKESIAKMIPYTDGNDNDNLNDIATTQLRTYTGNPLSISGRPNSDNVWFKVLCLVTGNTRFMFYFPAIGKIWVRNYGYDTWSSWESIATNTEITSLSDRIAALEKQIGGVLSSALNHLFRARKVAA